MPDEISGVNVLAGANGTALPAQSDATLTTEPELVETILKDSNFPVKRSGDLDWMLSYEGLLRDDTGKEALTNGEASLDLSLDINGDGTETPETVPGLQSVTLSLEQTLDDVPPGIDQPTGWNFYQPSNRDWTIETEGHYYDPEDSDIYDKIFQRPRDGEVIGADLNVFGLTFSGDLATDSVEREAGTDGQASVSLSFGGSDEITKSGSTEAPISAILDAYFNQTVLTSFFRHIKGGNVVSGSTSWEGDTYLSTAEITLERDAYPQLSYEVQGHGKLKRVVQ